MPLLILTSFAKKSHALAFGKKLVSERLAACATLLPGVTSIFDWKGKVNVSSELLLLIKTHPRRSAAIQAFFKAHHPYELPELLTISSSGSAKFSRWISTQTK
jgi:periplasmic divalent cation tolerance protein